MSLIASTPDTSGASLKPPKYRPDIDGLRAVAVLSVVGFHAFHGWIRGGYVGVDIFFVISGFLISTIIIENLENHSFSFLEFYSRRIRRIFPALLLVLFVCFIFAWFALLPDEYRHLGKHAAGGAAFVSNYLFWSEAGYFDKTAETKPLLHLWSLGIEEQFYIVWPLLLWALWRSRISLFLVCIVIVLGSLAYNVYEVTKDSIAAFYSPLTRCWELLAGALLAWLVTHYQKGLNGLSQLHANVLSVTGFSLITAGIFLLTKESPFPGWRALLPVVGAVLVIGAGKEAWINREILSHPVMVWFGVISFPLYLWHWPILSFLSIVESTTPGRIVRMGAVLVSIALAWLTYRLIERPIRFGPCVRPKVVSLAVMMAVVAYAGFKVYASNGYPDRSSIQGYLEINFNELAIVKEKDDECLSYINNTFPKFPYCRLSGLTGRETIAVIGDSHALAAFAGIANRTNALGTNVLLMATRGHPPFLGAHFGANEFDRGVRTGQTDQIISTLKGMRSVKNVFIITRGPVYLTGTEPLTGEQQVMPSILSEGSFETSLQSTIDTLFNSGKRVFYVAENPELPTHPIRCLSRPFRNGTSDCTNSVSVVMGRQARYWSILKKMNHVTLISPLDAFCPAGICNAFSKDQELLYLDDDHLSFAGSVFQADHVLGGHLEEIMKVRY